MVYVLPLEQAHGDEAWQAGPKAANLSALLAAGFTVPRGFVITVDAMDHYLEEAGLAERVSGFLDALELAAPEDIDAKPQALRDLVHSGELPVDLSRPILQAFESLGGMPISVRSSSTMEDRPDGTFAGQHDSFLNIQTEDALLNVLKQCWASLWTDRAVHYLKRLGISLKQIKMGVLVQVLVPAETSGVAFSLNPLTGEATQVSVSASYGLGESTVSGAVTPDHALVLRDGPQLLEYTLGTKASVVRPAASDGTVLEEIPRGQRESAALSEAQTLEIASLAVSVEEHWKGVPQDIEWAYHAGQLYLLQARPMVHAALPERGLAWESPIPGATWRRNWRLGEWLPEPVTPLFRTWLLPMLVNSREEFGTGELGWQMRTTFSMPQPWFCIVNGYFYTRQDRPFRPPAAPSATLGERTATRGMGNYENLNRWRNEYLPAYLKRLHGHLEYDIASASSEDLVAFFDSLTRESGEFWYLMAPIGYGFESSFAEYYASVIPEALRPHYTTFFKGFPSKVMEGEEALRALAMRGKEDGSLAERLLASTAQAVVQELEQMPDWLRQGLDAYHGEYGHQVYNLDLSFPTMGEAPVGTIAALQNYLRYETQSPAMLLKASAEQREAAERHVLALLADQPQEQEYLRQSIRGFQASAASREDAGFYLQRPWPLLRRVVLELGRRIAEAGVLEAPEQVFFVEKEELDGVLGALGRGEPVSMLHDVAEGREHTWEEHRKLAAPASIPEDNAKEGMDATAELIQDAEGTRIIGQSASPGRGQGTARIIHSPDELGRFAKGDVLVTTAASPALTPLLLLASALVTEAGGGASHSTLVARDLGVPTVVNTGIATRVIRDGQQVEVDGTRGIIRLL